MSRKKRTDEDPPSLFDLPLQRPGDGDGEEASAERQADESAISDRPPSLEQSDLFADSGSHSTSELEAIDEEALAEELDDRVLVRHRLLGGLFDVAVHGGILSLVLVAVSAMGVWSVQSPPEPSQWLAIGLFLLLFSFLYTVIPLAFWGRTPGMSRVHHAARASDGEPLTFGQTVRRWLGALFTLALAGLPLVLAVGERPSPADRLSSSETHVE